MFNDLDWFCNNTDTNVDLSSDQHVKFIDSEPPKQTLKQLAVPGYLLSNYNERNSSALELPLASLIMTLFNSSIWCQFGIDCKIRGCELMHVVLNDQMPSKKIYCSDGPWCKKNNYSGPFRCHLAHKLLDKCIRPPQRAANFTSALTLYNL